MTLQADDNTTQWFQWIVGGLTALFIGLIGRVHITNDASRKALEDKMDEVRAGAKEDDAALWSALRESDKLNSTFREKILENTVTKQDLKEMEHRLTNVFTRGTVRHD